MLFSSVLSIRVISVVLTIALLSCSSVSAEDLRFGLRFGGGGSWISFADEAKTVTFESPLQGEISLDQGAVPILYGGLYMVIPISGRFSLVPGATTSMRGGTLKGRNALRVEGQPAGVTVGIEYKETYKLTTADFALLARYTREHVGNRREARSDAYFFGAGPELSYTFHSKVETAIEGSTGGFAPEQASRKDDLIDFTNRVGLGLVLETGIEFARADYSVVLDVRFGFGLTNIYEAAGASELSSRHRALVASVGFLR